MDPQSAKLPPEIIQKQAQQLSTVIEQAAVTVVITDLKGNIVYVNPYFEKITGYNASEAIGQNPRILKSGKHSWEYYHKLWETITSGHTWHGVFVNRRKDGSLYHEDCTIFPLKNVLGEVINYAAVKRDITEQVQFEEALRESEDRYRTLVSELVEGVMLMDAEGRMLAANASAERILGLPAAQIVGRPPLVTRYLSIHEDGSPFPSDEYPARVALRSGKPINEVVMGLYKPDGSLTWISMNAQPLFHPGETKPYGVVTSFFDITERKRLEEVQAGYARFHELLNSITRTANEQTDLKPMLQILADRLGELFNADGCYLTLWDEARQIPIPTTAYGAFRGTNREMAQTEPGEKSLIAAVLEAGHPLVVEDVSNTPYMSRPIATSFPSKSLLGLPLIAGGVKLGAALISYETRKTFSTLEIERAETVAGQISLAILKTQLLESERIQRQINETLREVGTLLSASLEFDTIVDQMLDLIGRVVPFDAANILLVQEGHLFTLRARGYERFGMETVEKITNLDLPARAYPNILKVIETGKPAYVPDNSTDPNWVGGGISPNLNSWVGAPIQFEQKVIAIFSLDKVEPDFYTQEHADRLAAFTGQAALALKNAQLFAEVQQLAITDSLTGLANRRYFFIQARQEFERSRRYKSPFSILMLDLDHFKQVNDTYGHLIGDLVLEKIAKLCKANLREVDLIGRYGGEEFIILLPETQLEAAKNTAERLRELIAKHVIQINNASFSVTVSIGVSYLNPDRIGPQTPVNELEKLIDQADLALYQAKNSGRNQVYISNSTD